MAKRISSASPSQPISNSNSSASRRPFSPLEPGVFNLELNLEKDVVAPAPQRVPSKGDASSDAAAQSELHTILLHRLEEEVIQHPDAWGQQSPPQQDPVIPGSSDRMMPFSPPTRANNPMCLNSPFQGSPFSPQLPGRQGLLGSGTQQPQQQSSSAQPPPPPPPTQQQQPSRPPQRPQPPPDGSGKTVSAGERRRRLRSMSCPEHDADLVTGEA